MSVTPTGTLSGVSPRKPDALPPEVAAALAEFARVTEEAHAKIQATFRAFVLKALKVASVRQVAKAAGISPTTVQAWKAEADQ